MAVETVSRILNISMDPVKCSTSLLPQCIAQYTVGHLSRLAKARSVKMGIIELAHFTHSIYE